MTETTVRVGVHNGLDRPPDKDGVPLTDAELRRRKRDCARCGAPLWQADGSGPRRYPLSDYVKRRMRGFFDLLVGDEVHEYKGRGSAQGIAAGVLADVIGKSLSLGGTLMVGYSSTLFHLLYRFSPELRADFAHSEEGRWIDRYGFLEETRSYPDDDAFEDGRASRRKGFRKTVREKPGLVPSALFHIIGNSVFLKLADVASALPPYEEQVLLSGMDSEPDHTGYSQRSAYTHVFDELHEALVKALKKGSKRLLATYLQTLLAYPDGCTHGETVFDPASGRLIVQAPPLSEEKIYPKEQALVDLVAAERLAGRRVLVYATHTGTRDITGRMDDILTRHGFKVAVMKADAVASDRREAWVEERVKAGVDVVICHPRLVQTGLDLIDFPTLCWFETDYSVYTMRQASRRSWRIGQQRPVKVIYMAYRGTLQADALKLVAKKLQSSLAVEGELPEEGLAAYGDDGDDGDDLMMALRQRGCPGRYRDAGSGLCPGAGRRGRRRGIPGGRRLEGRRGRTGRRRCKREWTSFQRQRTRRRHRGDGRAGPGQRPPRQRFVLYRRREQRQRPPRRCARRRAAVPLLLGRVPVRGTGAAQGTERQVPARRRLFPDEAETLLAIPDVGQRLERFARLFEERHFPLYAPFIEFYVDEGEEPPFTWLRRGIPFQLMGIGYDGLHEMWDGYREGLSALALLAEPPDAYYDEPGGLRTAWLECAAERIPQPTLERIPQGGIPLETLREAVQETEYQGAAQAAAWVRAETGNFFRDHSFEDGDYDGFCDPWEDEIIQEGTEEWSKASALVDSVVKLADWLEEDLHSRFAEMLDFILPRLLEPTTEQEENDGDDQ